MSFTSRIIMLAAAGALLSGCAVAKTTGKVAALPFKGAYYAVKGTGKAAWATGKGIYYVGTVPVKITDKALDTTAKVLQVTTQAVDATGKVVTVSRQIQSAELNAELAAIKGASGVLSVMVDVIT